MKANMSFIIFLIAQSAGAVWWASSINTAMASNQEDIQAIKSQINSVNSIYITRSQIDDILGIRDEQIKTLQVTTSRIESKIDKVLEKI